MNAIVVTNQVTGTAGVTLVERPEPQAAINDVAVQIHASGFTGDELTWPSTRTDRVGRDRTPSIPGHELAGVVSTIILSIILVRPTGYPPRRTKGIRGGGTIVLRPAK